MKWILIYAVLAGSGVIGGNIEFNNQDACKDAAAVLTHGWQASAFCVAKGDEPEPVATTTPAPRASAPVQAKPPTAQK